MSRRPKARAAVGHSMTARLLMALEAVNPRGTPPSGARLAHDLDLRRSTTAACLDGMWRAGLVAAGPRGTWRLTDEGRAAAAGVRAKVERRDDFRARLWAALRTAGKVTAGELVQLAANGSEKAALNNARRFLQALEQAGYVRVLKHRRGAPGGGAYKIYVFAQDNDPGPMPPVVNHDTGRLLDPNRGEVRHV